MERVNATSDPYSTCLHMKQRAGLKKLQIYVGCEIYIERGSGHLHLIFVLLIVMCREYIEGEMDPLL